MATSYLMEELLKLISWTRGNILCLVHLWYSTNLDVPIICPICDDPRDGYYIL